jgi:hypothetical protein
MSTLIFVSTFFTLLSLFIKTFFNLYKRKPIWQLIKFILALICFYTVGWFLFYITSTNIPVPMGTNICFDDWCATVTQIEKQQNTNTQFIVLHIKMSNKARGIAQKPSEPSIKIIDSNGNYYYPSLIAQQTLEKQIGKQLPLDTRLELHGQAETQIAFQIPATKQNLSVLIEEGPFITKLLFYTNKNVFAIK